MLPATTALTVLDAIRGAGAAISSFAVAGPLHAKRVPTEAVLLAGAVSILGAVLGVLLLVRAAQDR